MSGSPPVETEGRGDALSQARHRAAQRSADAAVREALEHLAARGLPNAKWATIRRVRLRTALSAAIAREVVEDYGRRHGVPQLARRDLGGEWLDAAERTAHLLRLASRGIIPLDDALRLLPRPVVVAAGVLLGLVLAAVWAAARR